MCERLDWKKHKLHAKWHKSYVYSQNVKQNKSIKIDKK